jgi:hypothetical protein
VQSGLNCSIIQIFSQEPMNPKTINGMKFCTMNVRG